MNADQGIYVQDSWTLGRFTLNPGVRFEHFNSSIEARDARRRDASCRAGISTGARDVPNWNDVAPRFGFAWDVQGDGKTAVKFGIGKYVRAYSTGFAEAYDPNFYSSRDPDLERPEPGRRRAGDCAAASTCTAGCEIDFSTLPATFGVKPTQDFAEDIGRPYQIETNVSVQREIIPGASVTFSYFRRDYKNLIWSDNLAISPVGLHARSRSRTRSAAIRSPSTTSTRRRRAPSTSSTRTRRPTTASTPATTSASTAACSGLTLFGGVSSGHQMANTCQVEDRTSCASAIRAPLGIPYYTQIKINGSYSCRGRCRSAARSRATRATRATARWTASTAPEQRHDPRRGSVAARRSGPSTGRCSGPLTGPDADAVVDQRAAQRAGHQVPRPPESARHPPQAALQGARLSLEAQADAYNALNTGVVLTRVQTLRERARSAGDDSPGPAVPVRHAGAVVDDWC